MAWPSFILSTETRIPSLSASSNVAVLMTWENTLCIVITFTTSLCFQCWCRPSITPSKTPRLPELTIKTKKSEPHPHTDIEGKGRLSRKINVIRGWKHCSSIQTWLTNTNPFPFREKLLHDPGSDINDVQPTIKWLWDPPLCECAFKGSQAHVIVSPFLDHWQPYFILMQQNLRQFCFSVWKPMLSLLFLKNELLHTKHFLTGPR